MKSWRPNPVELETDLSPLLNLTVGALLMEVRARESDQVDDVLLSLSELHKRSGSDRLVLLHPFLFRFHNDYADQGPTTKLRISELFSEVLPRVEASRSRARQGAAIFGISIDVSPPDLASRSTTERLNAMARRAAGRDVGMSFLHTNLAGNEVTVFRDACRTINQVWPEMAAELASNIACIGFFESDATIGAADFACNGSIFLNVGRLSDPVKLAEEIIHEASHVRLNTAMASDAMVLNHAGELFQTPHRQDRRPMFGLFHQAFVLRRLREYYMKCSDALGSKYLDDVRKIDELLAVALSAVREHGRLTPVGRTLLADMAPQLPAQEAVP